ncbi:acyl carrier protein [Kribbella sp. NPDC051718]|uniref:acyl carrier protein n=1 Tax=Kribbella sp. NPDC051718 TaxID=3155168 RepID=UPI00343A7D1C
MPEAARSSESIQQYLSDWIARQGIESTIEPGSDLEEIGVDSLMVVDLTQALRRDLGIFVRAADLLESSTVADTVDLILVAQSAQPAP